MDLVVVVAIAAVCLLVGAGVTMWVVSSRARRRARTERLRSYFGDEYHDAVNELGRRSGEAELERRVEQDDVQPRRITPDRREKHTGQWSEIQFHFLDDPSASVRDAEKLVVDVMAERGFDVTSISTRTAALSVEQPELAERYKNAYDIHRGAEDGNGDIAMLFEALRVYRAVFDAALLRPEREAATVDASPPDATRRPRSRSEAEANIRS